MHALFALQKVVYDSGGYRAFIRYCLPGCKEGTVHYGVYIGHRYCCQGDKCNGVSLAYQNQAFVMVMSYVCLIALTYVGQLY